ncbi:MAG: response regulator [Clostridia bacterium]|nr:response regulator [Clostridia bacterium]
MANKVLIIDDDNFIVKIITDALLLEGFEVSTALDGIVGLNMIYGDAPDLILLDVIMPGMDGHEVCRMLRNDTRTSHVPILMLTSRSDTHDKVAGFDAGADDYITKPFAIPELVARVKTHIRRAKQVKSFNPLTGLPGNILIEEEIKARVTRSETLFAVMYLDLDNFKAYNDVYGFLKGDEVIKLVAHIMEQAVKELGNKDDFIGHIGGDDYIIITNPDKVENISQRIINQFDSSIPLFYNVEDRRNGYIITKNRQQVESKFPIMTISIAIVTNVHRDIYSHWEVAEIASELKKFAKMKEGSIWVIDRRKG